MAKLWVEHYRPKTIDEYVWRDSSQKKQVNQWIKDGIIPNILLSGTGGTGKSSLAWILIRELKIEEGDILELNAAEENSIDVIRNKILGFATTAAWGKFKVVLLEEADGINAHSGQNALKRILEENFENCRFILTTNNPHKITQPIQSRCQNIHITSLNEEEFRLKLAEILVDNDIQFDLDILDSYIKATIPDLRKAINCIQQNSIDGVLLSPNADTTGQNAEYLVQAIELFKKNKITEARNVICSNASDSDYTELYRLLYRNLDWFGDTIDEKEAAIIIIKDGLVNDGMVADREINFAATMVQLKNIRSS